MAGDLRGRTVAILAADGVERVELDLPRGALHGAGARVEVLSVHTRIAMGPRVGQGPLGHHAAIVARFAAVPTPA